MNDDQRYAAALGLLSTTLLWEPVRYPVLEVVSHPVSMIVGSAAFVYLFMKEMPLTAIVLFGAGLYLFREWSTYTKTPSRQLYLDKEADDIRFKAGYSVDLQSANKTLGFDAPSMLQGPIPHSEPLLTYPPSSETLRELSG